MMGYLDCISRCNNFNPDNYHDFLNDDGKRVGRIHSSNLSVLKKFKGAFDFCDHRVTFNRKGSSFKEKTDLIADIGHELRELGLIKGWRDELYPVTNDYSEPVLFNIERALTPFFGIRSFGVHINGYVQTEEGLKMWIAKRSMDKETSPGMLDNFVAGGQPTGISLLENVIKECSEEAGVPHEMSKKAKVSGVVAYQMEVSNRLKPDLLYCYDLQLPESFIPENMDGEVDNFTLMPIEEVISLLLDTKTIKENSALVMIDFLMRHKFITKENSINHAKVTRKLFQE